MFSGLEENIFDVMKNIPNIFCTYEFLLPKKWSRIMGSYVDMNNYSIIRRALNRAPLKWMYYFVFFAFIFFFNICSIHTQIFRLIWRQIGLLYWQINWKSVIRIWIWFNSMRFGCLFIFQNKRLKIMIQINIYRYIIYIIYFSLYIYMSVYIYIYIYIH